MKVIETAVSGFCRLLARVLPTRLITRGDDQDYLFRHYIFRTEGHKIPHVYLHHFVASDDEEELHNHPFETSYSLVLTGGYLEERRCDNSEDGSKTITRVIKPGMINVIRKDDFHKVKLLDPVNGAWTLFIAGKRTQDWGFWSPKNGSYMQWENYINLRKFRAAKSFLPNNVN